MNFSVTVNIPDYALWGGLAALAPVGVLMVLQLLLSALAMSAMSLGGSVRFEARVWVLVAIYVLATYVVGALIAAVFHAWWAGGIAGLLIAVALYAVALLGERMRR